MRYFALRYLTTLIFVLLTCSGCLAQGSISGRVCSKDGTAIVQATITLLAGKDSVVARTVTDSEGNYLLNNIHSGNYFVKASSTSYKPATKKVMLFNGMTMTVNFTLVSDAIQLDEVNVEGTGIIAHGDTTKYITRRFTTGQEQTLGDVLEALPGIKVDKTNNSVTANGKPVSRILVEKQDLFQGNNSVPLNNMPGQDVTSIDVIDNYSDYNILEGFKTSNETVISVNLDGKKKNRVSGKADLQAGIDNKYIVKDYTMLLKKKMMVSAIVSANNTGKALLNSKDVIGMNGGLSELLSGDDPQQKLMKTFADNAALIGDREDAYKRNNGIASLNTVFMPSKKVKVLWNSIFSLDHYRMNSDTRYSYLNVPLTYEISNQSRNRTTDVNSNLKLSFMPSKSFNIFYTGKVVYVHSSVDEQGRLINPFTNDNGKHMIDLENNLLAIQQVNFMGKKILVKGTIDSDTFEVVNGAKKEILGYECKEAVSKDKKKTVWFTDYIPVADGPVICAGITGLVLEASDGNNIFTATKISDTVSGTFAEPTEGQVMSEQEFKDYVKKTADMLKMGPGM